MGLILGHNALAFVNRSKYRAIRHNLRDHRGFLTTVAPCIPMTLRHFQIFLCVCDEDGMTRAAEKLHISQPSVSQAIRELEEHYGTRLFERLGKKLFLTAAGEELLQYAIILLGFEMNLFRVLDIGSQSFSVMIFTLLTAFMTAWGVGRLLHLDRNTTTLIGAGTGI